MSLSAVRVLVGRKCVTSETSELYEKTKQSDRNHEVLTFLELVPGCMRDVG